MIQSILLSPSPSQSFEITLNQQTCTINVYQKGDNVFLDLFKDNRLVIGGVIGRNRRRIVRDAYFGFIGDLTFVDMQGVQDPQYDGLGNRFKLYYIT